MVVYNLKVKRHELLYSQIYSAILVHHVCIKCRTDYSIIGDKIMIT